MLDTEGARPDTSASSLNRAQSSLTQGWTAARWDRTNSSRPVEESLAPLHRSGWTIEDCAVLDMSKGVVWIVTGRNGKNQIRTEGPTARWAWWYAIGHARELGMLRD